VIRRSSSPIALSLMFMAINICNKSANNISY
jgi:hypothetical protein